jgi:hypothetical protein
MSKPFSPACERNQQAILAVLRRQFADRRHVLEIGSGTGQHAGISRPRCRSSVGRPPTCRRTCPAFASG